MVVLSGFPFLECRQLLGYSGEKADNHTYRCRFHVTAELADDLPVLFEVSSVQKQGEDALTGMR